LAPTSTETRIVQAAKRAQGFIYLVSLTGTTGARAELPADLEAFIHRVRDHTVMPLAVGFGVSTPQQVQAVARLADGVIVGSALIEAVSRVAYSKAPQAAEEFVQELRQALEELVRSGNEVVP
jgi:tryptophan synthase alpha chain